MIRSFMTTGPSRLVWQESLTSRAVLRFSRKANSIASESYSTNLIRVEGGNLWDVGKVVRSTFSTTSH